MQSFSIVFYLLLCYAKNNINERNDKIYMNNYLDILKKALYEFVENAVVNKYKHLILQSNKLSFEEEKQLMISSNEEILNKIPNVKFFLDQECAVINDIWINEEDIINGYMEHFSKMIEIALESKEQNCDSNIFFSLLLKKFNIDSNLTEQDVLSFLKKSSDEAAVRFQTDFDKTMNEFQQQLQNFKENKSFYISKITSEELIAANTKVFQDVSEIVVNAIFNQSNFPIN